MGSIFPKDQPGVFSSESLRQSMLNFKSTPSTQETDDSFIMERLSRIATPSISPADFTVMQRLGKGAFGDVFLVQKIGNPTKMAMKVIRKSDVIKYHLIEATVLEKRVLQSSSHPFIVDLYYSFQTERKIYFIMEYIEGGDLYSILRFYQKFDQNVVAFLVAEVLLGIQFLHNELNIIYRDLKPENILITTNGHCKITDFGLSHQLKTSETFAKTFAGTTEYQAPEIIQNQPYTKSCDLWSIGILIYEMLVGIPPFHDKQRNIIKIEQQIIRNSPIYPSFLSWEAKDLIKALLTSEPNERLGATNVQQIKNHPFFATIQWNRLLDMQLESPIQSMIETIVVSKKQIQRPALIQETPTLCKQGMCRIEGITYNPDVIQPKDP